MYKTKKCMQQQLKKTFFKLVFRIIFIKKMFRCSNE